jgi:hypothetical protein
VKTGPRRVTDTPLRDIRRRGALVSEHALNPAYWGHLEHLSPVSLKPDDHNDCGLYAHGPDEDGSAVWDQQTEKLFTQTPPSRQTALGPQQIRRKNARRSASRHERNLAFVKAVAVTPDGRPSTWKVAP